LRLDRILSLEDFEHAARDHLARPVFAYVSGGVEDDAALRDNRAAFDELGFMAIPMRPSLEAKQS
jgi:L-lactate dehydrogenase (cytochrome)